MSMMKLVKSQRGQSFRRSSSTGRHTQLAWEPESEDTTAPTPDVVAVAAPAQSGGSPSWRRFSVAAEPELAPKKADFSHLQTVQQSISYQEPDDEDAQSGYIALAPAELEVDVVYGNLKAYYAEHAPGAKDDDDLRGIASRVSKTNSDRINGPMKRKYGESFDEFVGRKKSGVVAPAAAEVFDGFDGISVESAEGAIAPEVLNNVDETSDEDSDDSSNYDTPALTGRRSMDLSTAPDSEQPLYVNDPDAHLYVNDPVIPTKTASPAWRAGQTADPAAAQPLYVNDPAGSMATRGARGSGAKPNENGYTDIYPGQQPVDPAAVAAGAKTEAEVGGIAAATNKWQNRFKQRSAAFI